MKLKFEKKKLSNIFFCYLETICACSQTNDHHKRDSKKENHYDIEYEKN